MAVLVPSRDRWHQDGPYSVTRPILCYDEPKQKELGSMSSSNFNASSGDGYELQMGRWSRRLAPLFIEFAGVHAGAKVLDVGSGTGALSAELARNPAIGAIQ